METLNFEAVKIAMKQDKDGYVLTLRVHPDEVPDALFRDFVGARYQTVMVRLNNSDQPMHRENDLGTDLVRLAGILCREDSFGKWLEDQGEILTVNEAEVVEWMRSTLGVRSRSEISSNPEAMTKLREINRNYQLWKQNA